MREILDVDARQRVREGVLGLGKRRYHHLAEQGRLDQRHLIELIGRSGGARNIVGGDAPTLAGELVAAPRAPDSLENSMPYERLQHRLKMPRRQAVGGRPTLR